MPRKNEYTFVVERPMTHAAAERHAKFLTELFLKHEGLTAEMSVHELQSGEELCPIRLSKDFRAVG